VEERRSQDANCFGRCASQVSLIMFGVLVCGAIVVVRYICVTLSVVTLTNNE
jgi:hypothetical protein